MHWLKYQGCTNSHFRTIYAYQCFINLSNCSIQSKAFTNHFRPSYATRCHGSGSTLCFVMAITLIFVDISSKYKIFIHKNAFENVCKRWPFCSGPYVCGLSRIISLSYHDANLSSFHAFYAFQCQIQVQMKVIIHFVKETVLAFLMLKHLHVSWKTDTLTNTHTRFSILVLVVGNYFNLCHGNDQFHSSSFSLHRTNSASAMDTCLGSLQFT